MKWTEPPEEFIMEAENCEWKEAEGGIAMTGYRGFPYRTFCTAVPRYIEGKPVVEIGEDAFFGCTNLWGIRLPAGLKKIGEKAFCGCTDLTGQIFLKAWR